MTIPTLLRRLPARIPVRAAAFALRVRWVDSLELERDQAQAAAVQSRRMAERLDEHISETEDVLRRLGYRVHGDRLAHDVGRAVRLTRAAIDQRDRAVALVREVLTSPAVYFAETVTPELVEHWAGRLRDLLGADAANVCTCTFTARTGDHEPVRDASRCARHQKRCAASTGYGPCDLESGHDGECVAVPF